MDENGCNISEIDWVWKVYSHYPIVSMKKTNEIKFYDYEIISLGLLLSSALIKYDNDIRKDIAFKELDKIFNEIETNKLIIENIDILFNPIYSIDVLGFFIKLGRKRES